MATPPSPNPYISEMAFSCRFQKVYTYPPPPQVTTCLHMEAKVVEIAEKCQNPESWHILNVPERYPFSFDGTPPPPKKRVSNDYLRSMCREPSLSMLGFTPMPPPPRKFFHMYPSRTSVLLTCGCGGKTLVMGGGGAHAHGNTERQVMDDLRTEAQKQSNNLGNNQHNLNTPTTGRH